MRHFLIVAKCLSNQWLFAFFILVNVTSLFVLEFHFNLKQLQKRFGLILAVPEDKSGISTIASYNIKDLDLAHFCICFGGEW